MNYIDRARDLLHRTRKAPRMFASTREAMLAHICGIVSVITEDFEPIDFYIKHAGTRGNTYYDMQGAVEIEWAWQAIDDALLALDKPASTP